MEASRSRWSYLYRDYLPAQALAKDEAQPKWPVHLDHCFARIILDNAVGRDKPWMSVVEAPAVRHMTAEQLQAAISLAEQVANGHADLEKLNARSLEIRRDYGSASKKRKPEQSSDAGTAKKQRQATAGQISSYFQQSDTTRPLPKSKREDTTSLDTSADQEGSDDFDHMDEQLRRIEESNLTPFRKQMLRLLCQIPRGRYSTYQAMADHVTKTSHKSCARAVGNAMRNNPFAPEVPCHRVLATGGRLGGFGGSWGENGKYADKKHKLLGDEGVKFDSRGIVKGPPFCDFH